MKPRSRRITTLSTLSFALLAGAHTAGAADAGSVALPSNVRVGGGGASQAVERAVVGARRRLTDASCRQTLGDFADASGRDLEAALGETTLTPEAFLDRVLFYDGSAVRRCQSRGVHAVTTPGSRVVYICGREFLKLQNRKPEMAEAVIIHEMLHSLGLPTDEPTSWDITLQVRSRCVE